ncbi:DNA helicase UvrD [bacterium]|nr:DNA helicase UvrD [bacterium]|tara:strand:+ start:9841 stop:11127 length:1287 start_codon:yes stop_codon:yes gene_type:complete
MKYIADFHIHSKYSRATSKEMNIISLTKWSQLKGIQVVGTGDFTHPEWFKELQERLEPAEPGLYKLKPELEKDIQKDVPEKCKAPIRFILTSEISTIYKKNDKTRKVHSLVLAPSLEVVEKINAELGIIGNIKSDGRPILGLDTKELMKIVLGVSEECMFIPAHIWTPHFSVFGSQSGFDTLEECFEELTPQIYAVETGLSSDPSMNWRIKELDGRAIISNSDAHSPGKLGREANVFNTDLSYAAITRALKENDTKAFESTIEFYPEEGKYHLDGHRNCETRMEPKDTKKNDFLCTKCSRRVTVGVMHRVEDIANREEGQKPEEVRPFKSIVPLPEVISEVENVGAGSKKVEGIYMKMLEDLGDEFSILLDVPLEEIEKSVGPMVKEAVDRMRKGKIHIAAGYDGEFGTIKIFNEKEREELTPQNALL